MPRPELVRGHLSTFPQPAEIPLLQPFREVHLAPHVGLDSQLAGTGWHSRKEASRLISNYNQCRKEGKSHLEALMISAAETEVNIRTYIIEYIQSRTILLHLNRLEEVDGAVRMVGRNGVPIVNGITTDERNGSVLDASQKAEEFLTDNGLKPAPNKVAVINSPLGHSGLINENGKIINYKNNQTMVFWTDEAGELHGLTIVSDIDRKQSRELSVALGVDGGLLTGSAEAEQVANIVSNPALFSYGKSISNPAQYVFEKILAIRGNSDIELEQEDGSVEIRSVAQTQEDIEKFESLLKFKPFWEEKLKGLSQEILAKGSKLNHPIIQTEIIKAIEETILDITVDYLQQVKLPKFQIPPNNVIYCEATNLLYCEATNLLYFQSAAVLKHQNFEIHPTPLDKYAVAAAFLKTRAGCAGGGGSRATLRGTGLSSSEASSVSSVEGSDGTCKDCKQSNLDNHYHCPDCGLKYADETNTERTKQCACGFEFGCGSSGSQETEKEEDSKIIEFPKRDSSETAKAA